FDFKAVSKICKAPVVFRRIINNTPEKTRIFFHRLLSGKTYRLVKENIIRTFEKIFTLHNFILKMTSLPDYEIGTDEIDCKKSRKVKVTSVKDIVCIRLIRNLIHGIHIMDSGLGYMKKCWYLSNNIIKGV